VIFALPMQRRPRLLPEAIKHNAIHQAQEITSKSQHVKKAVDGHEV
jgi:hypothetical protein